MLNKFVLLCVVTYVVGYALTWVLYRYKNKAFSNSTIQTKIHTWIPIFIVVSLASLGIGWLTLCVSLLVIKYIVGDYLLRRKDVSSIPFSFIHALIVVAGMMTLTKFAFNNGDLLLGIWYIALLSDVTAFFFGNILGKHSLPDSLNSNKSWEGVFGQLVGSMLGYLAVSIIIDFSNFSMWIALIVGIGAAIGDLCNSYIKRKGGFKDWSNALPGHGGFIDRLSSLGYGALLVLLVTQISI